MLTLQSSLQHSLLFCHIGGKGEARQEAVWHLVRVQKKWLVVNLSFGGAEEKNNETVLEVKLELWSAAGG